MVTDELIQSFIKGRSLDSRLSGGEDPVILMDALDCLAEVNWRALQGTVSLAKSIHQTLARGTKYPHSPEEDILSTYGSLKENLTTMIGLVGNLSRWHFGAEDTKKYQAALGRIEGKISPTLQTIDRLFRFGYHSPSPYAGVEEEINVLPILDQFNGLFTEPVKKTSHLLSGGSKPGVRLEQVETVEELIRVLHDGGLGQIKNTLHEISNRGYFKQYEHIRTVSLSSDYDKPRIEGLGDSKPEVFQQSQVWPIVKAMTEYYGTTNCRDSDGWDKIIDHMYIVLSPRSVSSSMNLDYMTVGDSANCSFHAFYDEQNNTFALNFFCGNKGHFSDRFMNGVKKDFTEAGFTYEESSENKMFWLKKRSEATAVKEETRFILDTLAKRLVDKGY